MNIRIRNRVLHTILVIVVIFFVTPRAYASQQYRMGTTSNWNIRIDGDTGDCLGFDQIKETDINKDGKNDLVISADCADHNGRTDSGSVYIIYNSLLQSLHGTGNTINLSNPTNYNIRIDGGAANEQFSGYDLQAVDLNNDSANDLILSSYKADYNGKAGSGSIYVLYNALFSGLSGTGNTIDLNSPANYNIRFDGEATSDMLGDSEFRVLDLNQNGQMDLVITAPWVDYAGRADSGAVYVIKDSLLATFVGTGNNVSLATSTNYNIKYVAGDSYFLGHVNLNAADLNNDNKPELILTAPLAVSNTGYLYIINNDLFSGYLNSTGNLVDLTTSTNYTVRYEGAATGAALGNGNITVGDYNGDGKNDILIGSSYTGNGALYILLNSLLNTNFTGTGNQVSLASSSNFNTRIDGETGSGLFPTFVAINGDFNGDGKPDIITSAVSSSFNSISFSGAVYVIYNTTTDTSTGNTISLNTAGAYAMRYDGAAAVDGLGYSGVGFIDYNNDGRRDIAISTYLADNTNTTSGSYWIIYNFPHTITIDPRTSPINPALFPITGTVAAPDATTSIAGVQYQLDGNSLSGTWHDCTVTNGTFACTISDITSGAHTVYVRAYDTNAAYTLQAAYASLSFTADTTRPTAVSIKSPSGYQMRTNPAIILTKSASLDVDSYSVTLDSTTNRPFSAEHIPSHGNGTSSYVWKDDANVRIVFLHEDTPTRDDDEISITFRQLDSSPLGEGKHSINATVYDSARNSATTVQDFYIDNTPPQLNDLALAGVSRLFPKQVYTLPSSMRIPAFSGKITDVFTSVGGYEKSASGPFDITIITEKLTGTLKGQLYTPYSTTTWRATDITTIPQTEKSARFYVPLSKLLTDGYYRITIRGTDGAGNQTQFYPVFLSLNYRQPVISALLGAATEAVTTWIHPNPTPTLPPVQEMSIMRWITSFFHWNFR